MTSLLIILLIILYAGIAIFIPTYGAAAVLVGLIPAIAAGFLFSSVGSQRNFFLKLFLGGLFVRVLVGTIIYILNLHDFFGGDALGYDNYSFYLTKYWQGERYYASVLEHFNTGGAWGLIYFMAFVYSLIGRDLLAIQLVNAAIGAATAPVIFLCAQRLFENSRVGYIAAILTAFYPSIVLWSSQALKDGPIIFFLALTMLATMNLAEKLSVKYMALMLLSLLCLLSLRFYVFYMMVASIAGAFAIGMRPVTTTNFLRQMVVIIALGLAMMYIGVLRTATEQAETFANLEAVQRSRLDLASAQSGFGRDVDVSTTSGAISAIPLGMLYLLFAPFPWQLASLRQTITLPEMLIWWASFPLLMLGLYFTIKYRLRRALPMLIFTTMLTLAYSVFQGNIGTAYRQRAQVLVFYFIFVAVGFVLIKERRDEKKRLKMEEGFASKAIPRSPQNI